jgi:hypothetical protein
MAGLHDTAWKIAASGALLVITDAVSKAQLERQASRRPRGWERLFGSFEVRTCARLKFFRYRPSLSNVLKSATRILILSMCSERHFLRG